MLEVAPHSRATWLHNHNFLFWVILLWFWALFWLGFEKDHLLCPSLCLSSLSCFPGPFSILYVTILHRPHRLTEFHRLQNTQHSHLQVLTLPPVPQDKEENSSTTADVTCQLSCTHLAFCLSDCDRYWWDSPKQQYIKNCETDQKLRYIWSTILFFQCEIEGSLSVQPNSTCDKASLNYGRHYCFFSISHHSSKPQRMIVRQWHGNDTLLLSCHPPNHRFFWPCPDIQKSQSIFNVSQ